MISSEILFTISALLGLAAYFEPCTVATHSLFSESLKRSSPANRRRSLFLFLITRFSWISLLFISVVTLFAMPEPGQFFFPSVLAGLGALYLTTSFVYVPVPHLALYKIIPGNNKLAYHVKLGLTLPACTIPLFMLTLILVIYHDNITDAMLAAIFFTGFFSLPTFYFAFKGIGAARAKFLDILARGMTVTTSLFLFMASVYLLTQEKESITSFLKESAGNAETSGIFFGFLAGFIFSFNPVSFASVPVVLAYVTRAHDEKRASLLGGAFVAGMILTHSVLGIISGFGGEIFKDIMGRFWGLFLGPVLIVLGLMWPGWLKLRLPWFSMRAKQVTGVWGAFLLGIPFSVAICPFCTPALLVALTTSVAVGSPWYGFLLMTAFALGRSIPIIRPQHGIFRIAFLSFPKPEEAGTDCRHGYDPHRSLFTK